MSPNEAKELIKEVFIKLIENRDADEGTYAKYFSKDYIQYVDGKILDYDHFVRHMKALAATIKSAQVTFKHIIAEGDKVATIHRVNAVKHDGSQIEVLLCHMFPFCHIPSNNLACRINGKASSSYECRGPTGFTCTSGL